MGDQIRERAAGLACGDRQNCGAAAGHGVLPEAAAASHSSAAVPSLQAAHGRLLCAALVPALPLTMGRHVAHF